MMSADETTGGGGADGGFEDETGFNEEVVDLDLSCRPHSRILSTIRTIVTGLADQHGFPDDIIGQIEMAVDEACANVIRHAYTGVNLPNHQLYRIHLRIVLCNQAMTIHVIDNGIGLHNKPKGASNVEEYLQRGAKGGLGLHIMDRFMDEVSYQYPEDGGTHVIMKKYLPTAATS
ncbi:MAG: ATP-binding protein [Candidatus Sumerlaeia bacterium]|nr:ATP-binding protein [Candidatus Sumerlaeia bacterium]